MTTKEVKNYIWNFFKSHSSLTDEGIAGLMGNMQAESAFIPDNMQDCYERSLGLDDLSYTAAVDRQVYRYKLYNNPIDSFTNDQVGYGLCQWTYPTRKTDMIKRAYASGKSIGDLEFQCEFCLHELNDLYGGVNAVLKRTHDIQEASDKVLAVFENPADQSIKVKNARGQMSRDIYNEFHGTVVEEPVHQPPVIISRSKEEIIAHIKEDLKELESVK